MLSSLHTEAQSLWRNFVLWTSMSSPQSLCSPGNPSLLEQVRPEETAAIIVEPIMGEGGFLTPPASFFQTVRQLCDEHGILLIMDEVRSQK